jgi:branched-chain amino acid aminotransferase
VSDSIAVSIDGSLVDPERATISVFDRGLLYGDGAFEVLRTWNGVAVDLARHVDRLVDTARHLQLAVPASLDDFVTRTIDAAGAGEHRVRIIVTRGPGALGRRLAELPAGRTVVIVEPLPPQPVEVAAVVVDFPLARRHGRGHKTLAYLDSVVAREMAGEDEAIRLDADGNVAEGATSNVFVVSAGAVATPPVDGGVLPGIVRGRVLELCMQLGIAAVLRSVSPDELRAADEVFVTSSLRGVVAVTALDGQPRRHGPVTARIADAYAACMRGASKL